VSKNVEEEVRKAEQYLEQRTDDLLGQAHAQAQYQVYQASLFPLPSARPVRPGGRPRAPSPPPMDKVRHEFDRKIGIYGHNDFFRTHIRRLLRDKLGLEQGRAQEWAEIADYWVDYKVIQGAINAVKSKNPWAIGAAAAVVAVDCRGVYRRVMFELEPEQIKKTIRDKALDFLFERLKNVPK
jgi:hypothetical protein